MKFKKIIVLIICVCVILELNERNVKAEEMSMIRYKNNLLRSVKNETYLTRESSSSKLLIPCVGVITSRFGRRELSNPKASKNHKGVDIAADKGTAIFASHSGIVLAAESIGNYGKCVIIQNDKYKTIYAHCSELLVNKNEKVIKGQKIAEVGCTGNASGNHLHFEVIKDGKNINPEDVIDW